MGERRWQDVLWDWWFTVWAPFNRFLVRRHWIHCQWCDDGKIKCDCGAFDIPYEVTGGAHESFCIAYNPCRWCGREE